MPTSKDIDFEKLEQILVSGTKEELEEFVKNNNLEIKDGKIFAKNIEDAKRKAAYWDKVQHSTKLRLNGSYGALLQPACIYHDSRIGQSTTLSGRCITKHMISTINEILTGKYDHEGECIVYGDTDSVVSSTLIWTVNGILTIEELFNLGNHFWNTFDGKEYSSNSGIKILHYNARGKPIIGSYLYIYRHKTTKPRWIIETEDGKQVITTNDHSLLYVTDDNRLVKAKPSDLCVGSKVITLNESNLQVTVRISRIEQDGFFDNEYVYDIGVNNLSFPYFFANGILVHNSCYFTAWPVLKNVVESGEQPWNKDICVQMYDAITEQVNESFPAFMEQAFHTTREKGKIIKCGRELVGTKGLFIKKKRYSIMVYDMEGERYDLLPEDIAKKKDVIHGVGKVKAMGLDLKRADTPAEVQVFLQRLLKGVLLDVDKQTLVEQILEYRKAFSNKNSWEKGIPKKVNAVAAYTAKAKSGVKTTIPGHVQAAINWNELREMHGDKRSPAIVDGMKTVVCKLLKNPMGYTSISYPIDIVTLPEWFKELPFDDDAMEETVIMQKIDNMLGVLNLDLKDKTNVKSTFNSLFEY